MAKKIGKPKIVIWAIVTAICALLMATAIVGTYLANFHASALNNLFGCQTYKIVDNDTRRTPSILSPHMWTKTANTTTKRFGRRT